METTVRWFGQSWGALICSPTNKIDPPVGEKCAACEGCIEPEDQGVTLPLISDTRKKRIPYHLKCFMEWLGLSKPGDKR